MDSYVSINFSSLLRMLEQIVTILSSNSVHGYFSMANVYVDVLGGRKETAFLFLLQSTL